MYPRFREHAQKKERFSQPRAHAIAKTFLGSYDFGSLLAVIPVTYFGGRPGASKAAYIASGMFVMGSGSLLFASPHFFTDR